MSQVVQAPKETDRRTMDLVRRINQEGTPIFLQAQISPLAAVVGYLLDESFRNPSRPDRRYRTFFANSGLEALDGAIKIARHATWKKYPDRVGRVLVHDPRGNYGRHFDPLGRGEEEALAPGIACLQKELRLWPALLQSSRPPVACVINVRNVADGLEEIFSLCRAQGIAIILDESGIDLSRANFLARRFLVDVVVTGESLTLGQVPFGAFSMGPEIYRVWNNLDDCLIHTSTFGGNTLALTAAVDQLLPALARDPGYQAVQETVAGIRADQRATIRAFRRYVNPCLTLLLQSLGLDRRVTAARGTRFTLQGAHGEISVLDALGSYGSCLRGHNPSDIPAEVLDDHDPEKDYWQELTARLGSLTGLPRGFAAVSGATAVDTAIILGLAARPNRPEMVVFDKGYAGKTLIALSGTAKERYRKPFAPLYRHVHYVDAMAPDAPQRLESLLLSDRVGLVWLETIQGEGGVRPLPAAILETIDRRQEQGGYLVGVDEIQTGCYRTGSFLHSTGKVRAHIVSLAKGLSDMTFPLGAVMVTEAAYRSACASFPELVRSLEQAPVSQLGAHIALHGLIQAEKMKLGDNARALGEILQAGLREIQKKAPCLLDVRGEGLMVGMELDTELAGWQIPLLGEYLGGLFAGRCLRDKKTPILTAYTLNNPRNVRYEPALNVTEAEIRKMLESTERALSGGRPGILLAAVRHSLRRIFIGGTWVPKSDR